MDDLEAVAKASPLWPRYGTRLDEPSAREILTERLAHAEEPEPAPKRSRAPKRARRREPVPAPGGLDELGEYLGSREGRALQRRVARGLFGLLRKRL